MLASSSDVSIYVISLIQLYQSRISTPGVLSGPALLDAIAERSGGRHFAVADAGDFPDVTNKIDVELRNSYSLGYQPTTAQRDGTFRRVRVEVLPPMGIRYLTAMTRTGYYAAAPQR
jgi:Ca-activated chloride channel family protein